MCEMKNSNIGWVHNIPSHWKVIKGKYVFTNNKEIVGAKVDEYERLALTLKGVIKRSKDDSDGLQPEKFNSYQILKENELVFKLIDLQNVSTSRVGLSNYLGIVSPAYIILDASDDIIPSYAEKYYLMMWMYEVFNALGDSGVRSSLNATELLEIPLPLPPVEEQKNIAAFLERKCYEIDELYLDIDKQIEVLDEYKKSIIFEKVTKGIQESELIKCDAKWLPLIPRTWQVIKGKYCFETRNSKGNLINLELLSPSQKYGVIPQKLYEEYTNMVTVKVNETTNLNTS